MVMNNWMLVQYTNLFHPLSIQNLIMSNKCLEEIRVKLYLNHFPSFYVKKKTINGVTKLKMVIISNIIYIDLSIIYILSLYTLNSSLNSCFIEFMHSLNDNRENIRCSYLKNTKLCGQKFGWSIPAANTQNLNSIFILRVFLISLSNKTTNLSLIYLRSSVSLIM